MTNSKRNLIMYEPVHWRSLNDMIYTDMVPRVKIYKPSSPTDRDAKFLSILYMNESSDIEWIIQFAWEKYRCMRKIQKKDRSTTRGLRRLRSIINTWWFQVIALPCVWLHSYTVTKPRHLAVSSTRCHLRVRKKYSLVHVDTGYNALLI